ncbi:hypothetical protein [Kitasatospora purpeofusca]|uniref:hypothetical protein n=1 Tax=Kitasatospora purpeofusca TaxID=67352 RepID=UPI002A5A0CC7|nr:hypothetical protein [Kitasatospora purpeofusca]MDY0811110.1 hypothetical protein [Kitasatospora purpeofusca]
MRDPGPPPPPDTTTYRVRYAVAGSPDVRDAEVTLVPGHSRESDIPALLDARLHHDPDGRRIVLLDVTET